MRLKSYCVYNFRSIENSGWVECNDTTTLVGVNESGKTNMLKALWKFNPVREGEIDILHDMPVTKLSEYRTNPDKIKFVTVNFELTEDDKKEVSKRTGIANSNITFSEIEISRYYDGKYQVILPDNLKIPVVKNDEEADKDTFEDLEDVLLDIMPKFVYYSNYGNLSSKIYLPHALKWLKGDKVQGIDTNYEQVRTLRVLFDFVKLNPQEIMELGEDPKVMAVKRNRAVTEPAKEEILKAQRDKEQRSILLQSAATHLTKEFKNWWKQGEYRFRFEADGEYFRIWVSDEKRAEEVSLELRSTGLQWFLSFYLIFLMESKNENRNAILLLDEAGLTLHPLAQRDLVTFFENLAMENQIINSTHSPFIINPANIDSCRVVYVNTDGHTVVSSDLREGAGKMSNQSVYAVHAAMGLGVSDVLLQGCQCVIVEGPSDQYYLNAIKSFLIREKVFAPKEEIVFIPSGGVKGISGIVSLVASKSEDMPYVIIDSDKSGEDMKKKLISSLYKGNEKKLLMIGSYSEIENAEVEDIIPFNLLDKPITKLFKNTDEDFSDTYNSNEEIVCQIEKFAGDNDIVLEKGWKVELAKEVKKKIAKLKKADLSQEVVNVWKKLFESLNK